MEPRERVLVALEHGIPDRVPRFELSITQEIATSLGHEDRASAYVSLGMDCIPVPHQIPQGSNTWRDGIDEWGQVWKDGMYVGGVVKTEADLERYSPPLDYVDEFFDATTVNEARERYHDHCFVWGAHMGPFTAGFMAMGMEDFFLGLLKRPAFIRKVLEARTEWCVALFRKAARVGAEIIVLCDDAGYNTGPMISPQMWREFILSHHRAIVEELDVPVIWHSDGAVESLLPMAIEAGFVGVHALEPNAGIDLGKVKREFGEHLVLVGNLDVNVLFGSDLEAVREEVRRCIRKGAPGGGYMFSSCNSIFKGMNVDAVVEMYRYAGEIGAYL
jgi:uroporphyrinogen decarboxylase